LIRDSSAVDVKSSDSEGKKEVKIEVRGADGKGEDGDGGNRVASGGDLCEWKKDKERKKKRREIASDCVPQSNLEL
jgi:hypothetical protein